MQIAYYYVNFFSRANIFYATRLKKKKERKKNVMHYLCPGYQMKLKFCTTKFLDK